MQIQIGSEKEQILRKRIDRLENNFNQKEVLCQTLEEEILDLKELLEQKSEMKQDLRKTLQMLEINRNSRKNELMAQKQQTSTQSKISELEADIQTIIAKLQRSERENSDLREENELLNQKNKGASLVSYSYTILNQSLSLLIKTQTSQHIPQYNITPKSLINTPLFHTFSLK